MFVAKILSECNAAIFLAFYLSFSSPDVLRQEPRQRQREDRPHVGAGEGDGGKAAALEGRGPPEIDVKKSTLKMD